MRGTRENRNRKDIIMPNSVSQTVLKSNRRDSKEQPISINEENNQQNTGISKRLSAITTQVNDLDLPIKGQRSSKRIHHR